jgi:hypothetical protein
MSSQIGWRRKTLRQMLKQRMGHMQQVGSYVLQDVIITGMDKF